MVVLSWCTREAIKIHFATVHTRTSRAFLRGRFACEMRGRECYCFVGGSGE